MTSQNPNRIESVDQLDDVLSIPSPELVAFASTLDGPLVVLGAAGKMGPTLCLLARRALDASGNNTDVVAVSRFSSSEKQAWFEDHGIKTVRADLLLPDEYAKLPDASTVIFLVGQKFGTADNPALTWAINTIVPTRVAERYRDSRIVALSTGNVYPLVSVSSGGCKETHAVGPIGEYANACLARERLFEHAADRLGTQSILIRLNYATELRYGVLVDIAQKIKRREPIDVTMGYLNYIWQADANERIIRCLDHANNPPSYLNLTGSEKASVRDLAQKLSGRMNIPVDITGTESDTALLSDAAKADELFGPVRLPEEQILDWTSDWLLSERELLGKATHFQQREGKF